MCVSSCPECLLGECLGFARPSTAKLTAADDENLFEVRTAVAGVAVTGGCTRCISQNMISGDVPERGGDVSVGHQDHEGLLRPCATGTPGYAQGG